MEDNASDSVPRLHERQDEAHVRLPGGGRHPPRGRDRPGRAGTQFNLISVDISIAVSF